MEFVFHNLNKASLFEKGPSSDVVSHYTKNWESTYELRSSSNKPKSLENSKSALVCCSDEWRGWVSNNSTNGESCTSTSIHPLELTRNFLVEFSSN